jgi:hypothetical protein
MANRMPIAKCRMNSQRIRLPIGIWQSAFGTLLILPRHNGTMHRRHAFADPD